MPELTTGEKKRASSGSEEVYLAAQEADYANKLIKIAKRTGDVEMLKIGQARLRFALGRPTIEDFEFFSLSFYIKQDQPRLRFGLLIYFRYMDYVQFLTEMDNPGEKVDGLNYQTYINNKKEMLDVANGLRERIKEELNL